MDILNAEYLLFFSCAKENGLRYLLIGGYAVNYYGYVRNTHDLDIWLAPTNENKNKFIQTLVCMGYAEHEVEALAEEDFSTHFTATIGGPEDQMDFLTFVHYNIDFDAAEKEKVTHITADDLQMHFVPYNFLVEMKLLARRDKDIFDITQLNRLRNLRGS